MKSKSNSEIVSVRLPHKVLEDIDNKVADGYVMNKADFVRLAILEKISRDNKKQIQTL
ncbi:ribbon-helix-helix domain-containing protein [Candidatus Methanomassiliicoccus intestinalis]|jgi:ribbon-helix-helix protein, copG family|uniref:Ribbon-helix-helix protein CopG domain-containing protein n=1 Tax=Methanomassiliicoccus intestinalis (strain Issoire-Mx1) TaxID=1295009 RepID=R9TC04_METII|nr:ribbon-helix-helix domain-containing protein [Candidatus Methanomassiliicoccus intestinalis]AGN26983.1 hypothetical protein MMINT_16920 [Candidatus Methanomassiliicoccus intestinalis Issoire-Mx1]